MKTDTIRELFLQFFQDKNHKIFPSDSLIPVDPTLLFTSAGMNQFKPYFLGEKKGLTRAASCQKCLRTDDLDKVGKTAYHHTFFEMLGNFSFGDYFKKGAIEFAWEFLIKELNMKEKDLWISVYLEDVEALNIWKKDIGIPEEKIVKLGADKNFWPANAPFLGPNGPCGPCSEIFFDKGPNTGCSKNNCDPSCDCGRFVEIWNLVFTQFNRVGENQLQPLSQKNIDTGMGLERIASVLQGKDTNFQIDILQPIFKYIYEILHIPQDTPSTTSVVNAIVDHARAAIFAINDGVFPSNEERGYVVRKLIRKALYNGYQMKNTKPFIYKIVPIVAELMKRPYPELWDKKEDISQVILAEEEKFLNTLQIGRTQFHIMLEKAKEENRSKLKGEEVFKLYDTYGFPLETIIELAQENKFEIEEDEFKILLHRQKELSRKKSMFEDTIFSQGELSFSENTEFVGYTNFEIESQIIKIIKGKEAVETLEAGNEGIILLDKTPFYPESGGQLADKGTISTNEGKFVVENVKSIKDTIIHLGKVLEGKISLGKSTASIDCERRKALMRAHTATHLLQSALRKVLGTHVTQQGSLVDTDRLRFDFTHFKSLDHFQLQRVEELVNQYILAGDKVEKRIVPYEEAKKEKVLAFFEEKYKDYVRVVTIGNYSKELCGGTHVENTLEIGSFCILSEYSISSGIRRIEAVVGPLAYKKLSFYRDTIKEISAYLRTSEETILERINTLWKEIKTQKDRIETLEKTILATEAETLLSQNLQKIGDINLLIKDFTDKDYPHLLYLNDIIRKKVSSTITFFLSKNMQNIIFVFAVTQDLEKKFSCTKFISIYKDNLNLRGGGKPSLCQGIIKEFSDFISFKNKLAETVQEFLEKCVS